MAVGAAAPPEQLLAPVVRRLHLHLREAGRHAVLILRPHRNLELDGGVLVRVDNGQRAVPRRDAVHRPAAVEGGVALVGRDLVVDEGAVGAPVPQRDDQVALHALRPRRPRGQLAGGDPLRPVGEHRDAALAAEAVHRGAHLVAALPRLHAVVPGFRGGVEVVAALHHARGGVAELMAELAALLHVVDPRRLALHRRRDAVALGPGARKLARRRRLDQRVPVVPGVVLRGGRLVGRHDGFQRGIVERRRELHLRGIDEAVAAHPDVVGGVGQLRQHEAAVVVRHDDLDELRAEVARFRDDPDPGLGTRGALDHPADVALGIPRRTLGRRHGRARRQRGAEPRNRQPKP